MKYGLYYYKNTVVLGDDFWAYAQSKFYPHIDYLIDNTTIYKFKSNNQEPVATIVSAFVEPINREWTFFPPANIIPLFIGSYFRSTMWEYLDNIAVRKYLQRHQPIGVRSRSNERRLKEYGVNAYFTGCITLTLPQVEKHKKDYICCVDVPDFIVDYVKEKVGNQCQIKKMSHQIWTWPKNQQDEYAMMSIEERFKLIEEYIQTYADAHCVITTKLHCALPCLTQATPVLFVYPEDGVGIIDMNERVRDFFDIMHVSSFENFKNQSVVYDFINPPRNSDNWKTYKYELETVIRKFIKDCEEGKIKNDNQITEEERLEALVDILENKVIQLKNVVDSKNAIIRDKKE